MQSGEFRRRSWALAMLAACLLAGWAAPSRAASAGAELPSGPAFDTWDADGAIRTAVPATVQDHVWKAVQGAAWDPDPVATFESALALARAPLARAEADGLLAGTEPCDVNGFVLLATLEVTASLHPHVASGFVGNKYASPIERLCECDKAGSRACGCSWWGRATPTPIFTRCSSA